MTDNPQANPRNEHEDTRDRFLLDLLDVRATAGQIRLAIEGLRRRLPAGIAEHELRVLEIGLLGAEDKLLDLQIRGVDFLQAKQTETIQSLAAPDALLH